MEKYRAIIVGAGRIGAGYEWPDDAYTHAGAYRAIDRVELRAFVEPDPKRGIAALGKWKIESYHKLDDALQLENPDIVSVCTPPDQQWDILKKVTATKSVKGIWCEKPYTAPAPFPSWPPIQVNYLRRASAFHRNIARENPSGRLIVFAKDDIHTRCHFEDLAAWWDAELDYRPMDGPCAYVYAERRARHRVMADQVFFDNGGINPGECMTGMLANLLNTIEGKDTLWSPPR